MHKSYLYRLAILRFEAEVSGQVFEIPAHSKVARDQIVDAEIYIMIKNRAFKSVTKIAIAHPHRLPPFTEGNPRAMSIVVASLAYADAEADERHAVAFREHLAKTFADKFRCAIGVDRFRFHAGREGVRGEAMPGYNEIRAGEDEAAHAILLRRRHHVEQKI